MTLWDIALKNLRRRKGKAFFVLIGLMIGITSMVTFVTLVETLTHDINAKMEKYGANILITPKTENLSLTYGGLSMGGLSFELQEILQKDLEKIKTIKNAANVAAIGPMVLGAVKIKDQRVLLAGMDFKVSHFLRPWWKIQGSKPEKEEVLVGAEAAKILGIRLGSLLEINGSRLMVQGLLEQTGSQDDQMIFASLPIAQKVLGKVGRISMAEVTALCSGCPIEEMVAQISGVLPGSSVMAIKQVVKGRMATLEHFQKLAYGLSALVVLVGGLVVLVTMMGSVRERTGEIGIFRAIGFRRSHVFRIVLLEAGILSTLAGALGYLAGIGATRIALPLFTESHHITLSFNPVIAGGALGLAIFLGLLASTYPAFLAARLDPNEALRAL
ncbi:MAG: ABC transporter permease [Desulfobacca sp.]|nr:ABC transporter permease [Desulfobacca sp.]